MAVKLNCPKFLVRQTIGGGMIKRSALIANQVQSRRAELIV